LIFYFLFDGARQSDVSNPFGSVNVGSALFQVLKEFYLAAIVVQFICSLGLPK